MVAVAVALVVLAGCTTTLVLALDGIGRPSDPTFTVNPKELRLAPGETGTFTVGAAVPEPFAIANQAVAHWIDDVTGATVTSPSEIVNFIREEHPSRDVTWELAIDPHFQVTGLTVTLPDGTVEEQTPPPIGGTLVIRYGNMVAGDSASALVSVKAL